MIMRRFVAHSNKKIYAFNCLDKIFFEAIEIRWVSSKHSFSNLFQNVHARVNRWLFFFVGF